MFRLRPTPINRATLLLSKPPPTIASTTPPLLHQLRLRRQYATTLPKQKSATGDFYKTFTRPVAKCLLLALLTYQITYWGWVKLEQEEIKTERQDNADEIAKLEARVQALQEAVARQEAEEQKARPDNGAVPKKKGWWPF